MSRDTNGSGADPLRNGNPLADRLQRGNPEAAIISPHILEAYRTAFAACFAREDRTACLRFAVEGLQAGDFDIATLYDDILTPLIRSVPVCAGDDRSCVWHEHVKSGIVRSVLENCHLPLIRERATMERGAQSDAHPSVTGISTPEDRTSAVQIPTSEDRTSAVDVPMPEDRPVALVVCPERELHELGSRMAADALTLAGFRTVHTGANTPREAILQAVREEQPALVAISVTDPYNLIEAEAALRLLHDRFIKSGELARRPMIVAGGHAFRMNPGAAARIGAETVPDTFRELVSLGRKLCREWKEGAS